jgi:hypothetical protein
MTKTEHTAAVEQAATINEAVEQANARITKRAKAAAKAKPAKPAKAKEAKARKPKTEPKKPTAPRITNGERVAKLAEQPAGFTVEDITKMLGIQPHTARALISIELRKRRGLNLVCSKGQYKVVAPAA